MKTHWLPSPWSSHPGYQRRTLPVRLPIKISPVNGRLWECMTRVAKFAELRRKITPPMSARDDLVFVARTLCVETRLDALADLISKRRASRRVSTRQAEARAT